MAAFHPLWEDVSEDDVVWVDEHVGTVISGPGRS